MLTYRAYERIDNVLIEVILNTMSEYYKSECRKLNVTL